MTTLNTQHTDDGIACTFKDGPHVNKRVGVIRRDFGPHTELWQVALEQEMTDVTDILPERFMSLAAAEYFILAVACEYEEVIRSVSREYEEMRERKGDNI